MGRILRRSAGMVVVLVLLLPAAAAAQAAITGVVAGAIVMLFVKLATKIPFTWWVLIGSSVTFGTGWLVSFWFRSAAVHERTKTQ